MPPTPAPLAAAVAACALLGDVGRLAAADGGADGYASRADIPSGCELADEDLLADDSRCLFDDQCSSNYCCPYYKVCEGNSGFGDWEDDPLKVEILYTSTIGGEGTNNCANNVCDACAMRDEDINDISMCIAQAIGPVLTTSSQTYINAFGLWDTTNSACNCDSRFIAYVLSNEWVPKCGPPTPAPTPAPTPQTGCSEVVSANQYCSHWYHVTDSPGIASVTACRTLVESECPTCIYFSYRESSQACHMGNPSSVDPTCITWSTDSDGDNDINIYMVYCVDTDPTPSPPPTVPPPTPVPTAATPAPPTAEPTPAPTAPTTVAASYQADETLPSGVTSADLMSSTVYKDAKRTGVSAALSVAESVVAITDITVDDRRLSAGVRELSVVTVSVTTSFEVLVADASAADTLSSEIEDSVDDIQTETNSAMSAADWSGESVITSAPSMTGMAVTVETPAPTPTPTPAPTEAPAPPPTEALPQGTNAAAASRTAAAASCTIPALAGGTAVLVSMH